MKYSNTSKHIPILRDKLKITDINNIFNLGCEQYSNKIAYQIPINNLIKNYYFSDVFTYVQKLSRHIKEKGLGRDSKIALLGENRPEWAISYFSICWVGATVIPIDSKAPVDNINFILNFTSSDALITTDKFLKHIQIQKDELSKLKHVFLMDNFDNIYDKYSRGVEQESINEDDVLEILFTSGTTGNPNGVMLTHKNVTSNINDIYQIMNFSSDDKAFSVLPMHHVYECTAGFLSTFVCGTSVFFARSLKPNILIEDLKTVKPTIWLNTPLLLEKLYDRIEKQINNQKGVKRYLSRLIPKKQLGKKVKGSLGLENIKLIVSGGASLPTRVSEGLKALSFPIIQGYGLSEAAPLISANPISKPKNDSAGMIIPSDEVRIVDQDSHGNGEILAKGPNIMKGYYKNKELTDEVLTADGWLKTGDLGYFDHEGYLYITGRKKFVIVTKGGKNIYPEELEEKITKSRIIEEAVVFSHDDKNIQAIVHPNIEESRIVLKKIGKDLNEENLWNIIHNEIRSINKRLEPYKRINHFAINYGEFPKTTTRKIKRDFLKNIELNKSKKTVVIN